jgi:hypothetical protein
MILSKLIKYAAPSIAIFVAGYFCGLYRDTKKEIKQVQANHSAVIEKKEELAVKADQAVSSFIKKKDKIQKIKERVVYVQQTQKSSSSCVVSDSAVILHNEAAAGDN